MKQAIIGLIVFIAACNTGPTARQTFQRQFDSTGKKFDEYRAKYNAFMDVYEATSKDQYYDSAVYYFSLETQAIQESKRLYNEYYNK